jgi:hypothetical protein
MTSEELSAAIAHTIANVQNRIIGVGKEQYDLGSVQKIELVPIETVLDMAIEELDDLLAYIAIARIRTSRLRSRVNDNQLERP